MNVNKNSGKDYYIIKVNKKGSNNIIFNDNYNYNKLNNNQNKIYINSINTPSKKFSSSNINKTNNISPIFVYKNQYTNNKVKKLNFNSGKKDKKAEIDFIYNNSHNNIKNNSYLEYNIKDELKNYKNNSKINLQKIDNILKYKKNENNSNIPFNIFYYNNKYHYNSKISDINKKNNLSIKNSFNNNKKYNNKKYKTLENSSINNYINEFQLINNYFDSGKNYNNLNYKKYKNKIANYSYDRKKLKEYFYNESNPLLYYSYEKNLSNNYENNDDNNINEKINNSFHKINNNYFVNKSINKTDNNISLNSIKDTKKYNNIYIKCRSHHSGIGYNISKNNKYDYNKRLFIIYRGKLIQEFLRHINNVIKNNLINLFKLFLSILKDLQKLKNNKDILFAKKIHFNKSLKKNKKDIINYYTNKKHIQKITFDNSINKKNIKYTKIEVDNSINQMINNKINYDKYKNKNNIFFYNNRLIKNFKNINLNNSKEHSNINKNENKRYSLNYKNNKLKYEKKSFSNNIKIIDINNSLNNYIPKLILLLRYIRKKLN